MNELRQRIVDEVSRRTPAIPYRTVLLFLAITPGWVSYDLIAKMVTAAEKASGSSVLAGLNLQEMLKVGWAFQLPMLPCRCMPKRLM